MKTIILLICILVMVPKLALSQQFEYPILKTAIHGGIRHDKVQIINETTRPDFVNYIASSYFENYFLHLGITSEVMYNEKFSLSFMLMNLSAILSINLNSTFHLKKGYMFSLGYLRSGYYIIDYFNYHVKNEPDFILYTVTDTEDILLDRLIETNLYAGISDNINLGALQLKPNINIGVSTINPFKHEKIQKQLNSNYRRKYIYKSDRDYHITLSPEITAEIKLFSAFYRDFGLRFHFLYNFSYKSINYTRTQFDWDNANPVTTHFKNPYHFVTYYSVDIGIFIKKSLY